MQAMEMESFANVEIPSNQLISKGESTLLQENNNSIFDDQAQGELDINGEQAIHEGDQQDEEEEGE